MVSCALHRSTRALILAVLALLGSGRAGAQEPAAGESAPRFLLASAVAGQRVEVEASVIPLLRRRVSLALDDASVTQALKAIGRQASVSFIYEPSRITSDRRIRVHADGLTVAAALTEVLFDSGLDVLVSDEHHLAIVPRRARAAPDTGAVAGRVTDAETGQGLAQAEVFIAGTQWHVLTDDDGRYRLANVTAGSYTVTTRRIGYTQYREAVTVRAGREVAADFALRPTITRLDEVVTTVTGDQHRYELGNAIGRINADSTVATSPITNIGDLLNARVPGAQVLLGDGLSGGSPRLRLRGINSFSVSNDPIVIVDGTRVESSSSRRVGQFGVIPGRLSDLSPDEIESIEVVKGPSAATLYGTDAANGVLVIKTKRGRAGRPKWNAYTELGTVSLPGNYHTNWYAWGHTPDGGIVQCTLLLVASAACVQDSLSTLNLFTDPARTPLDAGLRQDYGLQVSGGTDVLQYFFSGGYQSETGGLKLQGAEYNRLASITGGNVVDEQVRPNGYQRANVRGNVVAALSPRLQLTLSTGFVGGLTRLPSDGSVFQSQVLGTGYVNATGGWFAGHQPSDLFAVRADEHLSRFTGSLGATWRMAEWLQSRATAGVDLSSVFDDDLQRQGQGNPVTGHRLDGRLNTTLYSLDLGVTATNPVGPSVSFQTAVGAQYNRRGALNLSASATGLAPGAETLTGAATTSTTETTDQSVVAGSYAQETMGLKQRLFLTAALRADGASSFGSNFNLALYPKASVSWLLSEEPFFPRGLGLSSLRLRAAFGASGVQPSATAELATLQPVPGFVDAQAQSGLLQATLGNRDLRPERQQEFEGGLDLELLRGRVQVEGTYYHRRSSDALLNATLGPSAGVASQFINLGSVQNKGWEGALSLRLIESRALSFELQANGSINSNKLLSLAPGVTVGTERRFNSQVVGYPLFGWWDRPLLGFSDANHNGIIEPGEVQVSDTTQFLGSTIPTRQLTLGGTVTLLGGRFAVSTLVDHRGGYVVPAYSFFRGCLQARNCQAVNDPATPLEDQARAVAALGGSTGPYTVSGAFWRWRELSVTATLPAGAARTFGARSLSLTVSGRNLALWSGFPGVDPEGNGAPGTDGAFESLSAPPARYWLVRLNFGY
jgi:TonB-linked SusC/RagA family outer membrane protein